jgi:hypothetical protein
MHRSAWKENSANFAQTAFQSLPRTFVRNAVRNVQETTTRYRRGREKGEAAPQGLRASRTKEEAMSPTRFEAILLMVFVLFLLTFGVVLVLDGFLTPAQEMMVATKVMGA